MMLAYPNNPKNIIVVFAACVLTISTFSAALAAGQAGLMDAVLKGDMAEAQKLIASGADIDRPNEDGVTPLMAAAALGDYYLVNMLLSGGADPGLRDNSGRTALMHAAENGNVSVGKMLIAARDGSGTHSDGGAGTEGVDNTTAGRDAGGGEGPGPESMRGDLRSLYGQGRYKEAAELGERILDERIRSAGMDSPETALAAQDLGVAYEADGDYGRARYNYKHALGARERRLGPKDPLTAESLQKLGVLETKIGDLKAAEEHLTRALAINREVLGPKHPATAWAMRDLAALLERTGRDEEAGDLRANSDKALDADDDIVSWDDGYESSAPAAQLDEDKDGQKHNLLLIAIMAVAVPAVPYLLYRAGLLSRFMAWNPVAHKMRSDNAHASTIFSKACHTEREGKLAYAAALYEEVLELDQDNLRARFQLARLLHKGMKDNHKAKKHYTILMKKLPTKHAYYRESADAINNINSEGLM